MPLHETASSSKPSLPVDSMSYDASRLSCQEPYDSFPSRMLSLQHFSYPGNTPLAPTPRCPKKPHLRWVLAQGVNIDPSAKVPCLCPSPYIDATRDTELTDGTEYIAPTLLHVAIAHRRESTAKPLMACGAMRDRPCGPCYPAITTLHMMAAGGMTCLIEWIADQCDGGPLQTAMTGAGGPRHDWPDGAGCSSLHYACLGKILSNPEDDTMAAWVCQVAWMGDEMAEMQRMWPEPVYLAIAVGNNALAEALKAATDGNPTT
ncbi:hypothetical protein LX36DRAFT_670178 [Colletotrichum falcatum]|nr:hypothetical protein LX36DRAFT_670178 [Colletotrichum falcatum]